MASYAAAGIAKSDPTKTGLFGMRLGFVSYIIPFAFVYNPALLAQGPLTQVLWFFTMAVIGIFLIANSFEGYMTHIGRLNLFLRISFSAVGVSLLFPFLIVNLIGLGIAAVLVIIGYRTRKPSVELP
jgi:TRAP-type uncharacterized transport system fused permease subunit